MLEINYLFGIGLFALNAMILGATDGGQVWRRIIQDRFGDKAADAVTLTGLAVLGVILAYSVVRDLLAFVI